MTQAGQLSESVWAKFSVWPTTVVSRPFILLQASGHPQKATSNFRQEESATFQLSLPFLRPNPGAEEKVLCSQLSREVRCWGGGLGVRAWVQGPADGAPGMGPSGGRSVAASVIPMWTARWVRLLPLSEECSAPVDPSPPHPKGQEGPGNY